MFDLGRQVAGRPIIDDGPRLGSLPELTGVPAVRQGVGLTRAGWFFRVGMGGGVRIIIIGGEGKGGIARHPVTVICYVTHYVTGDAFPRLLVRAIARLPFRAGRATSRGVHRLRDFQDVFSR